MGDLSDEMQRRLAEWRKKTLPEKLAVKQRSQKPNVFVSRKDYGDDIEFMRRTDEPDR
jgi:hypothetical protein